MRIGWEFGSLRICCSVVCCEMPREKKQQYIGSTSHRSSRKAWPRICNSFFQNISFLCFRIRLAEPEAEIFNLSHFMFPLETLQYRTATRVQPSSHTFCNFLFLNKAPRTLRRSPKATGQSTQVRSSTSLLPLRKREESAVEPAVAGVSEVERRSRPR